MLAPVNLGSDQPFALLLYRPAFRGTSRFCPLPQTRASDNGLDVLPCDAYPALERAIREQGHAACCAPGPDREQP